jgi:glycosyltransferase involved in cell wall biosynthesis
MIFAYKLVSIGRSSIICKIYVRGIWAALAVLLARPVNFFRYIYDVRGDAVDEAMARGRGFWRLRLITLLENFVIRRASVVSCVSSPLSVLIHNRARLKNLPEVIPSCIDVNNFKYIEEVRKAKRYELGYADHDIVLVYSGGMARYQMIPEMLALWRKIFMVNLNIIFLIMINSDPSSLESSVGNLNDFGNRLTILKLPRSKVFDTLLAADIGFLMRENRSLNLNSSPVKFPEYLAAGLAVVSSPGVGDISDMIIQRNLGTLVKPSINMPEDEKLNDLIRNVVDNRSFYKNNALLVVRERFDWYSHSDLFKKMYTF